MKIATFNAASVRARLHILVEWLAEHEPDVLGIQETKVEDDKFPISDLKILDTTPHFTVRNPGTVSACFRASL